MTKRKYIHELLLYIGQRKQCIDHYEYLSFKGENYKSGRTKSYLVR